MNKILYLAVVLVLLFILAACGNESASGENDGDKKELVRKIVLDGEQKMRMYLKVLLLA